MEGRGSKYMSTEKLLNVVILSLIQLISLWETGWRRGEGENQKGEALFLIFKQPLCCFQVETRVIEGGSWSGRPHLQLTCVRSLRSRGYRGHLFQ